MSTTLVHTTSNSLFYSAATAIIRYIYVKNSLKPNITEVMKKNAYKMKAIVTVESLGLYNFVSFFYYQYGKTGKDRIPFLGYQTCLDPLNSNFSVPFYKVLPVNQCLLWSSTVCIVVFNIFVKPESEVPKSKVPKSRPKGLGLTLKSHGPPPPPNF